MAANRLRILRSPESRQLYCGWDRHCPDPPVLLNRMHMVNVPVLFSLKELT